MARPFSMSSLWHHVSIPADVDGFLIPSPTWLSRFVHVFTFSLFSLSLPLFLSSLSSLPLSDGLSRDGEHGRSLSLSFSLLFLLSPSATVSLSLSFSLLFLLSPSATVSLSPSLSLFSFFSPPQRRSLSPSLSLFSFFSPPQRRSLSRRRAGSLSRRLT